MNKRFVYFYFMKHAPDKIRQTAPLHVDYWHSRNLAEYQGGPFADRSGGLISFAVTDLEKATSLVMNDPFVTEDLLENKWVKEWVLE